MSYIETSPLQNTTILRVFSEKDEIEISPEYQRNGSVWTLEKKKLLIDSILNDYDIPKIYFHKFSREEKKETGKQYSIIDGRQRLETIWWFMDNGFPLSDDFEYQDDESLKLAGMTYQDIAQKHPKIKIKFDSFVLPIIGVSSDDIDLIEDMFSRLNEAVPLNSAEKRNAFGGAMVSAIREISQHPLFLKKVKFRNSRYQHMEVSARFLLVETSSHEHNKLIDTKKVYLDSMVKNYKERQDEVSCFQANVISILEKMDTVFSDKDDLLRTQGIMVVYYLLFKKSIQLGKDIRRVELYEFDKSVKENRKLAEIKYEDADYDLLEYDRLSQHGTNDVSNIRERLRILSEYLKFD